MVTKPSAVLLSIVMVGRRNFAETMRSLRSTLRIPQTLSCEIVFVLREFGEVEISHLTSVASHSGLKTKLFVDSDSDLFDAMNIGLAATEGSCVLFLNSGDELISGTIFFELVRDCAINDVVWSCATIQYVNNSFFLKPPFTLAKDRSVGGIRLIESHNHQGLLCPGNIARSINFQPQWGSDASWMRQVVASADSIRWCLHPIAMFQLGGISNTPSLRSIITLIRHGRWMKSVKWSFGWLAFQILSKHSYYKLIYARFHCLKPIPKYWEQKS